MSKNRDSQRNVTLQTVEELTGKPFPCPLCGAALPLEITCKGKPYCTCNGCGIQMFFRGKTGIRRLHGLLQSQQPISAESQQSSLAVALYNRLSELKQQKDELEQKQGLFFRDPDLDAALAAIEGEISQTQSQLKKAGTRK